MSYPSRQLTNEEVAAMIQRDEAKKNEQLKPQEQQQRRRSETARAKILNEAMDITHKDRNANYGSPEDNFQQIADLWNAYLNARVRNVGLGSPKGYQIQPADVAVMNMLIKVARLAKTLSHHDSAVDIAGYAACLGEIQQRLKEEETMRAMGSAIGSVIGQQNLASGQAQGSEFK